MKKLAISLLAATFPSFAGAQTYNAPQFGIDVTGAAPYELAVRYNVGGVLSPWRQWGQISSGGVFTPSIPQYATTAAVKAIDLTGLTAGHAIYRQGFYAAGDGGGLAYYLSLSACSISSGAGNDFTQVAPNVGTGCWLAEPQPLGYDIRSAGMIAGDSGANSAANAAVMTKLFAEPSGPKIIVPSGSTFRLACGVTYSATAGISFAGSGTIKWDASCLWTSILIQWDGVSGGGSVDVTWDLNNPTVPASTLSVFAARAVAGNITSFVWDHSSVINGVTKELLIVGSATGGFTLSGFAVKNSYLQITPATTQNQCIALSTLNNAGAITAPIIENNTCVGSGIQGDGTYQRIVGNDVSGFKFGTGIFTAFHTVSATDYTSTYCDISFNVIHDTTDQLDANSSPPGGLENNCKFSTVSNNTFFNLSGEAVRNYSNSATYFNNYAYGVGKSTLFGEGGHTAYSVVVGASAKNQSDLTTWIGNVAEDDGTSTMHQSFRTGSGADGIVYGSGNQFAKGTVAAVVQVEPAANVSPSISVYKKKVTNLATAVSSIDFTDLDTATYKNWIIECIQFLPTTADIPAIKVSQDNGATWLTGSYTVSGTDTSGGTVTAVNLATQSTLKIGNITWIEDNSYLGSFVAEFSNLTSTSAYKQFAYRGNARNSAGPRLVNIGVGGWEGDTLAINAIQVVTSGGATLKAACTLTGEM